MESTFVNKTNTHPTHLYQIAHAHANKHATTKTKNAHANQHATTKKANFLHRPLQMQNPLRNCPFLVVQQTSTKLINDPTPQAIEGEVVLLLDFLVKFFFLLQLASCPLQLGVQPPNFTQCLLQLASRLLQLACIRLREIQESLRGGINETTVTYLKTTVVVATNRRRSSTFFCKWHQSWTTGWHGRIQNGTKTTVNSNGLQHAQVLKCSKFQRTTKCCKVWGPSL